MQMKRNTYFSLFFLFTFLMSFGINTYQGNIFATKRSLVKQTAETHFSSTENSEATSCNLLFEEENEQEEDGSETQAYTCPFLFSFFHIEILLPHFTTIVSSTEERTNPIYIAVCNFRI
jgi:hypothetical protein